jgi:hypothetical protein
MTFDIRKLAISQTADMPIKDVDGEIVTDEKGKEISITFFSPGSREHVKARTELQEEVMREIEEEKDSKKTTKAKAKSKPEGDESEEVDAATKRTAKFLARITKSLNGFDYPGGPEALFLDPSLGHITEDADRFVMKRGNFKPNSATDSSNSSVTKPG